MKFIVATICCFLIVTCAEGNPQRKIFGGITAMEGQFKYQVFLEIDNNFCGGSILNSKTILTACHCFYNQSLDIMEWKISVTKVFVGSINRNEGSWYGVKTLKCHKEFEHINYLNDIALLEVDTEIEFSENVQPTKLPTSNIADNEILTASGWGMSYNGSTLNHPNNVEFPDKLQFLDLIKKNLNYCKNIVPWVKITTGMLCAMTRKLGIEAICRGDSGGPLVAYGIQYGIVSFGIGDCASEQTEFFTNVFSYINWIKKEMFVSRKTIMVN